MPLIVILSQDKGPSVPTNPIDKQGGDIRGGMDFEMGEPIQALKMSTQGKGTSVTSTLSPTSTSELIGISFVASHPSTIVASISMVFVSQEILQILVES